MDSMLIFFKDVHPTVAATLYLGAQDYFDGRDECISAMVFDLCGDDTLDLSNLDGERFRWFYEVTKTHYDDLMAGRPARFNMVHPDDPELNLQRRRYFTLFMKLMEADPRLWDPTWEYDPPVKYGAPD